MYNKISRKINALDPIAIMSLNKWRIVMKAIEFQFNYCPLKWMFQVRTFNKINHLHEEALRIVKTEIKGLKTTLC